MEIETGHPIVLLDASGMEEHGLKEGMKGTATAVVHVDKTYVFFMPDDIKKSFMMDPIRFEVDEERLNALPN